MKTLVVALSLIFVIISPIENLQTCDVNTGKIAVAPLIFNETHEDAGQNVYLTRAVHNKLGVFSNQLFHCYFYYLDWQTIFKTTGFVALIFLIYLLVKSAAKNNFIYGVLFLIYPLIPITNFPILSVAYFYKLFAIIGLVYFLKHK